MPVAVIPFRPVNPKTRLSGLLLPAEREVFARAMLADVVGAVRAAGLDPLVLSTHPYDCPGVEVRVAPVGLSDALNALLPTLDGPVLVIMADLPLATPDAVRRLVESAADVAIAPGRGGGTNAIHIRDTARFHVDYYEMLGQQAPGDRGGGRALGRDRRLVPPLPRPRRGGGPRRPADPRRRAGPRLPRVARYRPRGHARPGRPRAPPRAPRHPRTRPAAEGDRHGRPMTERFRTAGRGGRLRWLTR